MIKQCIICGKDFEAKGKGSMQKKTCSPECQIERIHQRQNAWVKSHYKARKHILKERNREYYKKHATCQKRKASEHYKKNSAVILVKQKFKRISEGKKVRPFCCICGKAFKPKFYREHFCSDECREKSPLWQLYASYPNTFSKFFKRLLGE